MLTGVIMQLDKQKEFYNKYWSKRNAISNSKRIRLIAIMERLGKYCRPGSSLKILDLGCGDGRSVAIWSHYGQPFGLELSPEAVKEANRFYPEFDITEGDATNMSYEDNFFDIVINQEIIEHIEDQELMLLECSRILKQDGVLILTTPNRYYFDRRKGGNYSNQPIEKIIGPADLRTMIRNQAFDIINLSSIVPKKGHYGIYYLMDGILRNFRPIKALLNYFKNRFLFSAHLIAVAVNKKNNKTNVRH